MEERNNFILFLPCPRGDCQPPCHRRADACSARVVGSGVGILGDGLILDESAGTITADFCWVDDIWDYFACVQIDENVHMEIMYSSIKEVKLPNPDLSVIR